jgi:hypothetical protein
VAAPAAIVSMGAVRRAPWPTPEKPDKTDG